MYWANKQILKRSTTDFSFGGIENISKDKNYLYISNHRDIMLDASLLQNVLTDNGLDTCEITFGANLGIVARYVETCQGCATVKHSSIARNIQRRGR